MKEKIAIIGASEFQNPLILRAKEKGYESHVFAWEAGDIGEKTADVFHPVSIVDKEKILEICRAEGIAGICSIGSDLASLTVSYVAEALGLRGNSMASAELSTNKYAMRCAFKAADDPIPGFMEGDATTRPQDVALTYPLIVKPTDRSGSRGVTKIEGPDGLEAAIHKALEDSFEKKVMIEEFVEGKEYSVECISYEGIHVFLALTEKRTTGAPNFIEKGHLQPAEVTPALRNQIITIVKKALDTLQIRFGASHSEIIIQKNGVIRIVEIGGRMGGDCIGSHLVPLSTGYDFVGMVIDIACGKVPDFSIIHEPSPVEIRFIFGPEDLADYEAMKEAAEDRIVCTSLPEKLDDHPVTDSSSRYGFYIFEKERMGADVD